MPSVESMNAITESCQDLLDRLAAVIARSTGRDESALRIIAADLYLITLRVNRAAWELRVVPHTDEHRPAASPSALTVPVPPPPGYNAAGEEITLTVYNLTVPPPPSPGYNSYSQSLPNTCSLASIGRCLHCEPCGQDVPDFDMTEARPAHRGCVCDDLSGESCDVCDPYHQADGWD